MATTILTPAIIAAGVSFLVKFIEKKLNLKSNSYLWFGIVTFIFAYTLNNEIQHNIVNFFSGFNFVDQSLIIISLYGLWFVVVLMIFLDSRIYPTDDSNNPDLFPNLNETFLREWANKNAKKHGGIKLIQLYRSPTASQKYYLYFKTKKFYRDKFYRELFSHLLKTKANNVFLYPLKEAYRSNLPLNWQSEWIIDTKLVGGVDKSFCWTLYEK